MATPRKRLLVEQQLQQRAMQQPGAEAASTREIFDLMPMDGLQELHATLNRTWLFFEAINCEAESYVREAALHPAVSFFLMHSCGYINADGILIPDRERCTCILKVSGALVRLFPRCALAEGLQCDWSTFDVAVKNADGFGWRVGNNSIPALTAMNAQSEPCEFLGDVCVLYDAMVTDVGAPALARAVGRQCKLTHRRYGSGTAWLINEALFSNARSSSGKIYCEDWCVASCVVLSMFGPALLSIHIADDPRARNAIDEMMSSVMTFSSSAEKTEIFVVLLGHNASFAATSAVHEVLLNAGWSSRGAFEHEEATTTSTVASLWSRVPAQASSITVTVSKIGYRFFKL